MNILVSFPKSASDWLRYVCEYIYLRPTADENPKPVLKLKHMLTKINLPYDVPVDIKKEPIFIKKHYVKNVSNQDKLIFSYRDYKETIFSFMYAQVQQQNYNPNRSIESYVKNNFNRVDSQFNKWMYNFIAYYNHKGNKHILNYHALLSTPRETLTELISFIGRDNKINEREILFFDSLDSHTKNSINYKKHPTHMPNNSFGTKQKYTDNFLSNQQHIYIDNLMKSINKEAFEYLNKIKNEIRDYTV